MKFNDITVEQRIIEKTADLILKSGIKGWNMDKLSEEVGLAKNTLYKIIGSKEDLIEKVILQFIKSVQKQLVVIINREPDYLTAFRNVINLFPTLFNNFYTNSMQEIFMEYPSIEKSVTAHQDEITKVIINFIGKGIEEGIIKDEISKEFIFEMFQSFVIHFIKKGAKGTELSEKILISFNCLIDGIRKK